MTKIGSGHGVTNGVIFVFFRCDMRDSNSHHLVLPDELPLFCALRCDFGGKEILQRCDFEDRRCDFLGFEIEIIIAVAGPLDQSLPERMVFPLSVTHDTMNILVGLRGCL